MGVERESQEKRQEKRQENRGRGGRPPAGREGDVELRLLAAATKLFLDRGYDGTSCDQVALDARAGKASIYARYANKQALFSAVVDNMLARSFAQDDVAMETPLRERLVAVGLRVLTDALHPDALALLRLVVAELPRFAQGGQRADDLVWRAGVRRVAMAIALRDPGRIDAAIDAAERFIEVGVMPAVMRAMLGEATEQLLAGGPERIAGAIAFLEANGALDGWEAAHEKTGLVEGVKNSSD
jgi:AcrR family transcriptional regulator